MLEPREADIPALFLVFVVLPLVAYVLLGKWSEASKKRERVSLLAQLAAEEALRAEAMAVADVIPPVSPSKNGLHACARCFSPATTRCSRCKSVRYCSGKCQIIHWREVHRQECLQLEPTSSSSSPKSVSFGESFHEKFLLNDSINSQYFGCKMEQILAEEAPADNIMYPSISTGVPAATVDCASVDPSQVPMLERKRVSRKSNRELFRKKVGIAFDSSEEASCGWTTQSTPSNVISSKDVFMEHKLRNFDSHLSEEENRKKQSFSISDNYIKGQATSRNTVQENDMFQSQHGNIYESRSNSGLTSLSYSSKRGTDVHEIGLDFIPNGGNPLKGKQHPMWKQQSSNVMK
ncbi:ubiquitin carboxyl-terminal hydrolase 15 [Prunus yedoensis var. nudiflora]|uniref:Ubiquitin carboxyl-terminal hydrolase 15 n=1 Tax=Prunus yedoensis var. nudiflora TaxID=2094558 RepID=A0A314Y5K6_PRUYE|nr:ubiquitin carboxyl-terminal hydrolase 15 [Prunus yedoensis var. nudiflora]